MAPVHAALARYALAAAAAAAALAATHAVVPLLGGPFFFFVFPAVLLAAVLGGAGPGLCCAALYSAAAAGLFVSPLGSLEVGESRALTRLMLLSASSALVAIMGGRLRSALERERRLRERLERENAARTAAEDLLRQAHERLAAVQGLTAALSAANTSEQVAEAVFQQAFALVGARAGSICFRAGELLEMRFSDGVAEDARREYRTIAIDAPLPTTQAARTGRGIWLGSAAEIDRRYPQLAEARARWGDRAWACVPLRVEDDAIGVLGLSFREERAFDAVERAFIASIAQLCAQAFSRTRRHEAAQEARVRAETAEDAARRAAALQDQVLAVVGHDLRTPISAILMAVQAAQRRAGADEGLATMLARIARSAWRMNEIIRDLLDAARARQGLGMTLTRRRTSAYEICTQAIAELEQVHPGRSIRLSASGDATLEADGSRLLQAISNLVANAVQHGDPERNVAVQVSGDDDAEVSVRVRNAGAPIPPGAVDELFEPFRRGDNAADGNGSLGLGLFIVREIVRAHGGTVSVSSDAGGTTFELRLPRTAPGAGASASAEAPG